MAIRFNDFELIRPYHIMLKTYGEWGGDKKTTMAINNDHISLEHDKLYLMFGSWYIYLLVYKPYLYQCAFKKVYIIEPTISTKNALTLVQIAFAHSALIMRSRKRCNRCYGVMRSIHDLLDTNAPAKLPPCVTSTKHQPLRHNISKVG